MTCLTPTYRRPKLLANAIACFERQTYPAHLRELLILDDAGQYTRQQGNRWAILTEAKRHRSLPDKFNRLLYYAKNCGPTDNRDRVFVIYEDDDTYLPWALEAHAAVIQAGADYSHPSTVWSTYGGDLHTEDATGRFHASLAIRSELLQKIGGWPDTPRADFDQQLLAKLKENGTRGDPCASFGPSYVFRWQSTGQYHGQAYMRSPDDTDWYDKAGASADDAAPVDVLTPELDAETREIYRGFGF